MLSCCAQVEPEKKEEIAVPTADEEVKPPLAVDPLPAVSEEPGPPASVAVPSYPSPAEPVPAAEPVAETPAPAAAPPAAPAVPAATTGGETWEIKFEKTGPLGVGMKDEKGTVKIGNVGKDGILAKYNAANKDSMALPGDVITSVNGMPASTMEGVTNAIKSASGQMSLGLSRPDDGSQIFTISIEKTGPLGLGLGEKTVEKTSFTVISTVKPDGLIKTFNNANPGSAVEQGDTIIAVNGTFGTAADTKTALTSATGTVEIVLKRGGATAASAAKQWTVEFTAEGAGTVGLGLQIKGSSLIIGAIREGAVADRYNKANASSAIMINDEVVAVNSVTGDPDAMKKALQKAGAESADVKMDMKRG